MTKKTKNDHQWYQRLQLARTTTTAKNDNNQQYFIIHRYNCHDHKGNLLQRKGRLIQPNSLLRVLTANVPSLSPKINELIAPIQVENFDVISLNVTCLDTQNKHLIEEVAIQGYKVFHVNKKTSNKKGRWIHHVC